MQLGHNSIDLPKQVLSQYNSFRSYLISSIFEYVQNNPTSLEQYPHLSNILNLMPQDKSHHLYHDPCLGEIIAKELFSNGDLSKFLEEPLRNLVKHPKHNELYETDKTLTIDQTYLNYVMNFILDQTKTNLKIIEIGTGTGGITKKIFNSIGKNIDTYMATDLYSVKIDLPLGNFYKSKWDCNQPFENKEQIFYDVVVACNCIHASSNLINSLNNAAAVVHDDGFLVLEEHVKDLGVYLWGLDSKVWKMTQEKRRYALWISFEDWIQIFANPLCKWEPVGWYLSASNMLMVAKKKNNNP